MCRTAIHIFVEHMYTLTHIPHTPCAQQINVALATAVFGSCAIKGRPWKLCEGVGGSLGRGRQRNHISSGLLAVCGWLWFFVNERFDILTCFDIAETLFIAHCHAAGACTLLNTAVTNGTLMIMLSIGLQLGPL